MIIILSPSKTLDFDGKTTGKHTIPEFLEYSQALITILQKLKPADLSKLMDLSDKLSKLNWQRYRDFQLPFTTENARQSIYAFKGDVYEGLVIENFSATDVQYAQSNLRIISGLYGLLRPLDLIQPYRLEMGTKLANKNGKDLYNFWGNDITNKLSELLESEGSGTVVNLASEEYYKAVNTKLLKAKIITPIFKEKRGDSYKIISFSAKKARGMMAGFILKNRIDDVEGIKSFNKDGYKFNKTLSTANELVFFKN
jgi:cytoplasmic iron level regulating protein YaaA (DUF328/UPF0246 family)